MKNPTKQSNTMKKFRYPLLFAVSVLALLLYSCSAENPGATSAFKGLQQDALNSITQNFHFNANVGEIVLTSAKGVTIFFDSNSFTLNGNPVTGQIDLKFIEIFDDATMLTTGMHTMGLMPDGKHAVMSSAGEFYINATKNGHQLELTNEIQLVFSSSLTDNVGGNPDMTLWNFTEEDTVWAPEQDIAIGTGGVILGNEEFPNGTNNHHYHAYVDHFGWTNVDCFYNDPRPKTTILASVPEGYNNENSAIYLHYDGQGNALALLDTYDSETALFSEHYGQIPIGLVCHVIFVTEDNGQWRYAIKPATITAGAVHSFTLGETTTGTEAQLTAAITALP